MAGCAREEEREKEGRFKIERRAAAAAATAAAAAAVEWRTKSATQGQYLYGALFIGQQSLRRVYWSELRASTCCSPQHFPKLIFLQLFVPILVLSLALVRSIAARSCNVSN